MTAPQPLWPGEMAPVSVVHVDLRDVAAPLAAAEGARGALAIFWLDGRPVGERLFGPAELPVPPAALRTLGSDLAGAKAARDALLSVPPAADGASVAVVVCTRDRLDDLDRCLKALRRCDPAPAEIVVVDNAPRRSAAEVVARHPGVRLVTEMRPGLSHARNRGVTETEAPLVAFTDDDVEVAPDWIGRLRARFDDESVASVTGIVLPQVLETEAMCLFEFAVGGLNGGYASRVYDRRFLQREWYKSAPVWQVGAGANMTLRRAALARVGLFDPRLGAGASGCSEDSELWNRLLAGGFTCVYDPAIVVHHRHRADGAGLARQLRSYMEGHVVALMVQYRQDRSRAHIARTFFFVPRHFVKLWLAALWHGDRSGRTVIGPQLRGWARGIATAPRWLRRPGPPALAAEGEDPRA